MNRHQVENIAAGIVETFNPARIVLFLQSRERGYRSRDLDLSVEMETDRIPPLAVAW